MDIVKRLENLLAKDQVVAFDWGEMGVSIDRDIELAIEEIKRLRQLIDDRTGLRFAEPERCAHGNLKNAYCLQCGRTYNAWRETGN